ncbi:formamidopyrimidine-DNA glycosylase [Catovirus CTV1]|uniref:Formamidopyrimidine-DNA glycosylase n=1 Tax=Catovirus CTV1 TaxID=1977631 RepID=A0A1V0S994_9VIRU|nr:formamidopyrimidine-DNA glycosylase [Catovirus CTV1]
MPEGPEIKLLSEYINKNILDANITNIVSLSKNKVIFPKKSKIISVGSKGKLIWLKTKSYVIHILLRISGWIYNQSHKYTKYILVFDNGEKIYVDDARKLCIVRVLSYDEHNDAMNELGIDVFSDNFTSDIFYKTLLDYNINICAFLMNQYIFCGIGNYIKNESLYLSKINPKRKTSSLTESESIKLYNNIKFVYFSNLVEQLNDYKLSINKTMPKKLEVPYKFKVYGQKKDPNGYLVNVETIAGRNTYFVNEIQI